MKPNLRTGSWTADLSSVASAKPTPTIVQWHYTRTAIVLHWTIGLALLSQIGFGLFLDEIAARGTPARGAMINLHKSIGMVLGVLILLRLLWRLRHPPPPWPATTGALVRGGAVWGHRALYGCMIVMPSSGYVASNFSKYGVRFFGTSLRAWGPDLPSVYALFNSVHVFTAYVFCALIAGHVLAALHHALIRRDGIFCRMWS